MSEALTKQKELEEFLFRKFFEKKLHYTISQLDLSESPDAFLTLKGKGKRIAIEHVSYFNDKVLGKCSALPAIGEFWKKVETSLCQQVSHRKHLSDIEECRVKLNNRLKIRGSKISLAKQFAQELVGFLEKHPFSGHKRFPSANARPPNAIFSGFPTLESTVSYILIWRNKGGDYPYRNWICDNISTGCIGLDLNNIKENIKNKNKLATKYNWQPADEKWLLIAADGKILSNKAGPPEQQVDWNDLELGDLCRKSPFGKIIFWEYVRDWYKSLKPNCPIVREDKGVGSRRRDGADEKG